VVGTLRPVSASSASSLRDVPGSEKVNLCWWGTCGDVTSLRLGRNRIGVEGTILSSAASSYDCKEGCGLDSGGTDLVRNDWEEAAWLTTYEKSAWLVHFLLIIWATPLFPCSHIGNKQKRLYLCYQLLGWPCYRKTHRSVSIIISS